MLSVLLIILKIILLTIVILLGIAIVLLLFLLFLPFCYQFYGKYEEEGYIEGSVRWLLVVVNFKTTYEHEELTYDLKSFGYTIYSNRKEWQERKKSKKNKSEETKEQSIQKNKIKNTKKKKKLSDSEQKRKIPILQNLFDKNNIADKNKLEKKILEEKKKQTILASIAKVFDKVRFVLAKMWSVFAFFFYFPWKVKESILLGIEKLVILWRKVKPILAQINLWKGFLKEKSTKDALKHIFRHLKYLWRGIKPKKFYGELHFGFEEPDKTGKILGMVGSLYGVMRKYVNVVPYFDKKILKGSFYGKGKIRLFHIVKTGFRVYRDKLLRHKWKQIQRLMNQ